MGQVTTGGPTPCLRPNETSASRQPGEPSTTALLTLLTLLTP
jgi:hypothetical protein